MQYSLSKKVLCAFMLMVCINLREVAAVSITDETSGTAYTTGHTFNSTIPISAVVDAAGTIAAYNIAANTIVKFVCSNALTITTLTLGRGAKVYFTGISPATVTNTILDATGAATLGMASGGVTLTNQPTNMLTATVLEFLSPAATFTCNNGAAWVCTLLMVADGVFTSSTCTSLGGVITGPGALTLPVGCATITSTGGPIPNRGATANSIVFGCAASFTNANIFSTGILTLLYDLAYAGIASPPAATAPLVIVNAPPCSSIVLGASVTINGGNGLTIKQITDTASEHPTLAGNLTVNTYNPTGNHMNVASGPVKIKKMTLPTGTFSVHNPSNAVINMGT